MGSSLHRFGEGVGRRMRLAVNRSLLLGVVELGFLGWATYNISRMKPASPSEMYDDYTKRWIPALFLSALAIITVSFFVFGTWVSRGLLEKTELRCSKSRFIPTPVILILMPFVICDYALCHIIAIYAPDFRILRSQSAESITRGRARSLLVSLILSLLCSVTLTIYGTLVTCRAISSRRRIRKYIGSIEVLSRSVGILLDEQHDESLIPRYYDQPSQQFEHDYWVRDRYFGWSKLRSATFHPRCFVAYWLLGRPVLVVLDLALAVQVFRSFSYRTAEYADAWAVLATVFNTCLLVSFAMSRDLQRIQHHLIIATSKLNTPHMYATYIVLFSSSLDTCQMGLVLWNLVEWPRMWSAPDNRFGSDPLSASDSGQQAWNMVAVILPMVCIAVIVMVLLDVVLLKRMYIAYRRTRKCLAKAGYNMKGLRL